MGRTKNLDKIGEIYINNSNESVEIIDYINAANCTIKFTDGTIIYNKKYYNIVRGNVKNPNKNLYYNIGFIGEGKYNSNNCILIWNMWEKMLMRCYDKKYQLSKPTYISCTVDERWHNFQVFAEWFEQNYIEGFQLDKDILVKGNKVYGPDTCCFVPQEINITIYSEINDKNGLPKGINFADDRQKYRIKIGIDNKQIYLGQTDTLDEAISIFKKAKEKRIIELAYKYKSLLNKNVFNILINWKWE